MFPQWYVTFFLLLLSKKPLTAKQLFRLVKHWFEYCMSLNHGKNVRNFSSYSGCLVFKCLANCGGFILLLANISRHSVHLGQDHG